MLRFFRIAGAKISSKKSFSIVLKQLLGFSPENLSLYQLALRHRSSQTAVEMGLSKSNERLEFLGDAVLGTIVAHHLFKLFPFKDEGFLTRLRSRIVSRDSLNQVARKIGLDELIEKRSNENSHKSINGDALEALIGAIFIDKGYEKANRYVIEKIIKSHIDIEHLLLTEVDYKSRILEWATKNRKVVSFQVTDEIRLKGKTVYKVGLFMDGAQIAEAEAGSKKSAEQLAAEQAFKTIGHKKSGDS